jgi:hypothetical protein
MQLLEMLEADACLSIRQTAILSQFIEDMRAAIGEVSRVLVAGGRAIYVVGENTIEGTYIQNSKLVAEIARYSGLVLERRHERILPPNRRYLPPPATGVRRDTLDGRIRREVILSFRKPSASP